MSVLSFDISSSGISAALFDRTLQTVKVDVAAWRIRVDEKGTATLVLDDAVTAFKNLANRITAGSTLEAVSIGCFMHSIVVMDEHDRPITPVFTWLDRSGERGVESLRERLGGEFHRRTGCRFHPMYPVFKLAALPAGFCRAGHHAVSLKAAILKHLTGVWAEDHGMASGSGLYNIVRGEWDLEILELAGLRKDALPPLLGRYEAIGRVTPAAASQFGIGSGTPVINGSGDGLLANTGSGCDSPERIAVTLGTSASARQSLRAPVFDEQAGTFCYKADSGIYVLGCASNNGANVLDWSRSMFGDLELNSDLEEDLPLFIPLLYGERSPDWNPRSTASWHGLTFRHGAQQLGRSVVEGVAFNLGGYMEILERTSGFRAEKIVLSGNGFLSSLAGRILASVRPQPILLVQDPGLASLRGAAACALRGLGVDPNEAIERLIEEAAVVPPIEDDRLRGRFEKYKELRGGPFQAS